MAAADMDLIGELPGFKIILKAVLRAQIQQLVEQLSAHTDEESVILTASVTEGTLCHLGSDFGRGFLEEHKDVKKQFLGFCLKRHHEKLQEEKEREKPLSVQASVSDENDLESSITQDWQLPFQNSVQHRSSPQGRLSGRSLRHEPYHLPWLSRRTSISESRQDFLSSPSTKNSDHDLDVNGNEISGKSNTRDSHNTNSSFSEQFGSKTGKNTQDDLQMDSDCVVKIEDSDTEIEIIGVEPGHPEIPLQTNENPDVAMGMNIESSEPDLSTSSDRTEQSLNKDGESSRPFKCDQCDKTYSTKGNLSIHMKKKHCKTLPYKCSLCHKTFAYKCFLKNHSCDHE